MNRIKRLSTLLLGTVVFMLLLCSTAGAVEIPLDGQNTDHTGNNLRSAVASASANDTIIITGNGNVNDDNSKSEPWVIDKPLTIKGVDYEKDGKTTKSTIYLRSGGIVLGADVTFENLTLSFANQNRNAIMANGHTLTLKDVAWNDGMQKVNLFCGGIVGYAGSLPTRGTAGKIIFDGRVNLGGNVYAGNVCEPSITGNEGDRPFSGTACIEMRESASGDLGEIYACGAVRKAASGDWFSLAKIDAPTPNKEALPVTGTVTIDLRSNLVSKVDADAGDNKYATVNYLGGMYPDYTVKLVNVKELNVQAGPLLCPAADSSFANDANIALKSDAMLSLVNYGASLTISSLKTEGENAALVLGREQCLTIADSVTGTTKIGVGQIFLGKSDPAIEGQTYIIAPESTPASAFVLLLEPAQTLEQQTDAAGQVSWVASEKEAEKTDLFPLKSVILETPKVKMDDNGNPVDYMYEIPYNAVFLNGEQDAVDYFASIPLDIVVNGYHAVVEDDGSYIVYKVGLPKGNIQFEVIDSDYFNGEGTIFLQGEEIELGDGNTGYDTLPDGIYHITVTVPAAYTADHQPITVSTTVTIGEPEVEVLGITQADGKFTVTAGEATGAARLVIAIYTGGQLQKVAVQDIDDLQQFKRQIGTLPDGQYAIFLLDGNGAPLCPALKSPEAAS